MILNCLNPRFSKKFVIDYYFEMVQKLKFCVYDIDNNTYDLSDDDFLGELECTLGQVSFPTHAFASKLQDPTRFRVSVHLCVQVVSNKEMTRQLLLKNRRPAGHGTITVRELNASMASTSDY